MHNAATIRRAVDYQLSLVGTDAPAPAEPSAFDLLDVDRSLELERRLGKQCGDCGTRFAWPGTAQSRCPDCRVKHAERVAARANAKRTCVRCGEPFKVQGRATRCPNCRNRRAGR